VAVPAVDAQGVGEEAEDAMKVLAAPSPTPAPTGRLREWNGGVPGHGETQPTDGSAPLEFSSKFGSRLWMSPDDELPPTVSGEACTLRQLIRQGTFPDTGTSERLLSRALGSWFSGFWETKR